jgi:hypothetical protein
MTWGNTKGWKLELLRQLHNKVVGASTFLSKCFYGNDRKE